MERTMNLSMQYTKEKYKSNILIINSNQNKKKVNTKPYKTQKWNVILISTEAKTCFIIYCRLNVENNLFKQNKEPSFFWSALTHFHTACLHHLHWPVCRYIHLGWWNSPALLHCLFLFLSLFFSLEYISNLKGFVGLLHLTINNNSLQHYKRNSYLYGQFHQYLWTWKESWKPGMQN